MSRMNRSDWLGTASIAAIAAVVACNSSSSSPTPTDAAIDAYELVDSSVVDSSVQPSTDASAEATTERDAEAGSAGSADAHAEGGEGAAAATLTVLNFLSWCSVSINGSTPSTNATVTASVVPGSTAMIVATPASSAFQIGAEPWFGVMGSTDGGPAAGVDNGSGTTETSTAMVDVTGNQCVSVCCQEPSNSPTPCPTTDPCP